MIKKIKIILFILISFINLVEIRVFAQNYPEGMIHYLKFDEGNGQIAYDCVGNNHGNIYGGTTWTNGIVNKALYFDGAWNSYVALDTYLEVNDAMSVEIWIFPEFDPANPSAYPPSWPGVRCIIRKASNYNDTFWLSVASGRHYGPAHPPYISGAFFYEGGGDIGLDQILIPGLIFKNQWHHIAITFKRNDYARIYVNGIEKMALPTEDKPLRQSSRKTVIGQTCDLVGGEWYWINDETWIGKMDEAAIYNRALTPEEIQRHYKNGLNGLGYEEIKIVSIDIKPDSFPNSINLKSKGNVPVAILSDQTFDATIIDRDTVKFADASSLSIGETFEDVNNDGLLDVVLHFKTQELNLQVGNTEAYLTGKTNNGYDFKGCDNIHIIK